LVARGRWGPVLGHARRASASAFAGTVGGCATARGAPIGPDPNNGRFFSSLLADEASARFAARAAESPR
jgi:hypothetical protein